MPWCNFSYTSDVLHNVMDTDTIYLCVSGQLASSSSLVDINGWNSLVQLYFFSQYDGSSCTFIVWCVFSPPHSCTPVLPLLWHSYHSVPFQGALPLLFYFYNLCVKFKCETYEIVQCHLWTTFTTFTLTLPSLCAFQKILPLLFYFCHFCVKFKCKTHEIVQCHLWTTPLFNILCVNSFYYPSHSYAWLV